MRTIYCFCSLLLLTACAGTPPAWWDPAGTYSGQSAAVSNSSSKGQTTAMPAQKAPAGPVTPAEEEIEPLQDTYEEMNLSVSGEVIEPAAKGVSETKTEMKAASVSSEPAQAAKELSDAEDLPTDGSLPAPSVLN